MLVVINEGRDETKNLLEFYGIYANRYIYDIAKFSDLVPYMSAEDIIMVFIHGFSTFSKTELFKLLNDIHNSVNVPDDNLIIFSDILLSDLQMRYYLYDSNPFTQGVSVAFGDKVVKGSDMSARAKEMTSENAVIKGLQRYNTDAVERIVLQSSGRGRDQFLGADEKVAEEYAVRDVNIFTPEQLAAVDAYKNAELDVD